MSKLILTMAELCFTTGGERKYCHILGFPGNATMKQTCPHNNEMDASIQQCKQAVIE
jgi:hypothetical protein